MCDAQNLRRVSKQDSSSDIWLIMLFLKLLYGTTVQYFKNLVRGHGKECECLLFGHFSQYMTHFVSVILYVVYREKVI